MSTLKRSQSLKRNENSLNRKWENQKQAEGPRQRKAWAKPGKLNNSYWEQRVQAEHYVLPKTPPSRRKVEEIDDSKRTISTPTSTSRRTLTPEPITSMIKTPPPNSPSFSTPSGKLNNSYWEQRVPAEHSALPKTPPPKRKEMNDLKSTRSTQISISRTPPPKSPSFSIPSGKLNNSYWEQRVQAEHSLPPRTPPPRRKLIDITAGRQTPNNR